MWIIVPRIFIDSYLYVRDLITSNEERVILYHGCITCKNLFHSCISDTEEANTDIEYVPLVASENEYFMIEILGDN